MSFTAWRRAPEAGACDFCLMLATRGAVYKTQRTAGDGNKYHRRCRCRAELETDFDRREDIRISPEDANRQIGFRGASRDYAYDMSDYRNLGVTDPPRVPTPAPVRQVRQVGKWVPDESAVRKALLEIGVDPEFIEEHHIKKFHILTNGVDVVEVPRVGKSRLAHGRLKLAEQLAADLDESVARLPKWRRFDDEGQPRGYVLQVNDEDTLGLGAEAFTFLGHNHIWISTNAVRDRSTRSGSWLMKNGDTPNGRSYVAHELGHTVDHAKHPERDRLYDTWRQSGGEQWKSVSEYGRTDPTEMYAELFSEWMYGDRTNPAVAEAAKVFRWDDPADGHWRRE